MGPHWIMLISAAAGAGAAGAAAYGLGTSATVMGAAAMLGATSAGSLAAAASAVRAQAASDARFETLAQEMILIRQRQAETDARLETVERQALDSPALVWRAATSDIQVLGALVSDLAKSVAEHEQKLAGDAPMAEMPETLLPPIDEDIPAVVLPRTSPPPAAWFEDEPEIDIAAAPPSPPAAPTPTSAALVAELRSTLAGALADDRLEICLQPYVTLPQRRVAGYEAALALKSGEGTARDPDGLRMAARASGMAADMDRLLVERAGQVLRILRARERSVAMTCAISGTSLDNAEVRSAVEAVARAEGKLAQNLLLSIPLADAPGLLAAGGAALKSLQRSGVSLGVHATSARGIDAAVLERLGVREFRLPAAALVGSASGVATDIHPADLNELLERRGIRLLISGIDDEATVRDLLDCSAAFGQGTLFGANRPVRPEVLQPRTVADAQARSQPARPAAEAQAPRRQSFRSVLRRA